MRPTTVGLGVTPDPPPGEASPSTPQPPYAKLIESPRNPVLALVANPITHRLSSARLFEHSCSRVRCSSSDKPCSKLLEVTTAVDATPHDLGNREPPSIEDRIQVYPAVV